MLTTPEPSWAGCDEPITDGQIMPGEQMLLKGLPKRHSLSILSEHLNSALSLLTSTPGTRALQLTEPLIKTRPVPLLQSERRGPGLLLGTSSKAHTHTTRLGRAAGKLLGRYQP